MCLISRARLSWRLAVFCASVIFNVGHYAKTFKPDSFLLVMPIATIDFCYFRPFSITLPLLGGRKVGAEYHLLASFFDRLFY